VNGEPWKGTFLSNAGFGTGPWRGGFFKEINIEAIVPYSQLPNFIALLHKWFVSHNFFGFQIFHQHSSNRKGYLSSANEKRRPFNLGFYLALILPAGRFAKS
jgi:hypothetical protein